ncbi:phage holin family protein [Ligilactobacillus sp. Marseille-Q7487]|uniref:phage holin family protein n=1 Tax=Ligilactobacillus sp. Marseille-Q7487 TaxID=3022128 RepID=UPI0015B387AD|nr:phage holin family protein [Ligilactobacillus sp. Marseille-Q7487]
MNFIQRALLNAVIFIAAAGLFPANFHVANVWVALMAAVILGILNMVIKPILVVLSLPITILTLGFFYLCINAFILMLTSIFVSGFYFANFGSAFLIALILSGVNLIITNHFAR